MIRVMVIDDSPTSRQQLCHGLGSHPEIEVVSSVSDPENALEILEHQQVDFVIVDIIMPKIDGYELVKMMKLKYDIPAIIVSSRYDEKEKEKAIKAFEVGALTILEKPVGVDQKAKRLMEELTHLISSYFHQTHPEKPHFEELQTHKGDFDLVAIGSSLGGPQALSLVLKDLPKNFPIPVVIVQHIAEGFVTGLVNWLNESSANPVQIAPRGEKPQPGQIYIAPSGIHLLISQDHRFVYSDAPPVHSLKPSISLFFQSVGEVYQQKAIGVILTGMGADGTNEMVTLKKLGAYTIAQHKDGCLMYGMPKKVIEMDGASAIIPINEITQKLVQLVL